MRDVNTFRALTILLGVAAPALAVACPFCDTETGRQINAGIFDGSFGWNVALVLSPFLPMIAIVVALVRLLPLRVQAPRATSAPIGGQG